jgi:transposase
MQFGARDQSRGTHTTGDNAPAHSSHLIEGFLSKHGIPQVRQAPYSPEWLFVISGCSED